MKKRLIGLLIVACLLLTACTATDPDNLFEIELDNNVTSTSENNDDTIVFTIEDTQSNAEDIVCYADAYQYGNMQKINPAGNFMLLNNEVIINPLQEIHTIIYSYDLLTGKTRPLCKDATCDHKTCVARMLQGNLEVYKGKLYGMDCIVTKEGSWLPVVVNENVPEVILDASISSFFHHEDKLYIKTKDKSLVVLEEGQKEPQMVLEEYTGFWATIWGDYLYANTYDLGIIRVDITAENPKEEILISNSQGITDGQHIYYTDQKTWQLYRCNMDGSDPLLIDERKVMDASMNFDDEYFYYRLFTEEKLIGTSDCYDIYRFPKTDPTQIEKIVTLPNPVWQVFTVPGTGKIFVTAYQFKKNEDDTVTYGDPFIYVMGTDGSNPTKLEFPES